MFDSVVKTAHDKDALAVEGLHARVRFGAAGEGPTEPLSLPNVVVPLPFPERPKASAWRLPSGWAFIDPIVVRVLLDDAGELVDA